MFRGRGKRGKENRLLGITVGPKTKACPRAQKGGGLRS